LVSAAALACVGLGSALSEGARRRRDARLFLISLAFVASAGFLALHALATPGVLLGPNGGFELATPVGLVLAGAFAAASAVELRPQTSARIMAAWAPMLGGLFVLLVAWGAVSIGELPPLDEPASGEELDGWQLSLAAAGVVLYVAAAAGYARVYRRRRAGFLLAVTIALALLGEAMVVIAWARNWQLSWVALARAHAARLRPDRGERAPAVARGASQRALPGRHARGVEDVSILFADLEGFTPFSERNGARAVKEMLDAYFGRIVPMMEHSFGGEAHQLIGDAVMVVFNKDGGQEREHALLAARAGLALQGETGRIGRDHPQWPRFRVGINSGEAVTGAVGGDRGKRHHGVVGDTVNVAARLVGEAHVGEVVIGAGTYERLPDGATVEFLPNLRVKGKEAPVEAYRLRSLPVRV